MNTWTRAVFTGVVAGTLLALFVSPAGAQAAAQPIRRIADPAQEVDTAEPRDGQAPPAVAAPPGEEGPPAPDAAATPLLVAVQQQNLERKPEAVLQARRDIGFDGLPEVAADADAPAQAQAHAERLRSLVVAGYWEDFARFLAKEAGEEAAAVYDHVLATLAAKDTTILPEEVLVLADASPGPPGEKVLENLGKLLAGALQRGAAEPLLERLRKGTRYLGGDSEEGKTRACDLLVYADRMEEAKEWLPPLLEENPPSELLRRHGRYMEVRGRTAETAAERFAATQEAWGYFLRALHANDADTASKKKTLDRVYALIPRMPDDAVESWREELFTPGNEIGHAVLAYVGEQQRKLFAQKNSSASARSRAMRAIHETGRACLEVAGDEIDEWRTALGILALAYIDEARYTRTKAQFGSNNVRRGSREKPHVEPLDLYPSTPGDRWIAAVEPGLAELLREQAVAIAALADEWERGRDIIHGAHRKRPQLGQHLAEVFVREWSRTLDPNRLLPNFGRNQIITSGGVVYYAGGFNQFNRVPMTRAKQMRSLHKLGRALADFRALGLEPVDPVRVANAFIACHSRAEVYRLEDVETLFGPLGELPPEAALTLARKMWQELQRNWRSEQVQKQAGTRRTSKEIELEVERGYLLGLRLGDRALASEEARWRSLLIRSNLAFDLAEFYYEQDPDLERYAPLRTEAFEGYAEACQDYRRELEAKRTARSSEVFLQWFVSALGASELGYLTRDTQPHNDQVEQLTRTLGELPADEQDKHLGLFARGIDMRLPQLKPEAKARFVRHAMRVIGDHPEGRKTQTLADLYADLVDEVLLSVEVDGSTDVAAGKPFGIRIGIRFTDALERESGGFDKYLRNQVYMPMAPQPMDYKDDFDEAIRKAFQESFEVHTVTFHAPEVKPTGFGRPGWQEKPLGYAILSPRDAAVDKIPPIQLDLDFPDGTGSVVLLPVASPVVPIDASKPAEGVRPVQEMEAELTLDDRELGTAGVLKLEVRVSGKGVIPALEDVLADVDAVPGYERRETEDFGLNVVQLAPDTFPTLPQAERSWLVSYAPRPGDAAANRFHFPQDTIEGVQIVLKRYADMDIVQVEDGVRIDSRLLPGGSTRWGLALGAVVLLGAAVAVVIIRRRRDRRQVAAPRYSRPVAITPLSTIGLLRRIQADGEALTEAQRVELGSEIHDLERAYFSTEASAESDEKELAVVLDRWLSRVA